MKRRAFLTNTGAAFGGSWISLSMPAILATAGVACKAKEEGVGHKCTVRYKIIRMPINTFTNLAKSVISAAVITLFVGRKTKRNVILKFQKNVFF